MTCGWPFKNRRDAIPAALIAREREALLAEVVRQTKQEGQDGLESALLSLVEVAVTHQLVRPELARALDYAERLLPLADDTADLTGRIEENVEHLLRAHGVSNAQISARDVVAMTRGMIDAAGLAGECDRNSATLRVMRAVMGYLHAGR